MRRVPFLLLPLLLAGGLARADVEEPSRLRLEAERVVVFKDGHALVVKRGAAEAGPNGEVFTTDVPDAAVLGSFWAMPEKDAGRLVSVDAGRVTESSVEESRRDAANLAEVLAWNEEARLRLELHDKTVVEGTVRKVLGAELVVMQTDAGEVVLPVGSVRRVDGAALKLERTQVTTTPRSSKRLTFRFDGAGAKRLRLLYFRPSVRWIPTYRLELPADASATEAALSLQAEILNEAEDLGTVPVHLVVGVPNFRFREVVSPFSLEPVLHDALAQAAPQLMAQMAATGNAFRSRASEWLESGAPEGGAIDVPEEIVAGGAQDLFVYEVPPTPLPRGHRVAVPIFDARVPFRHVHTWDVNVRREDPARPPARDASPLRISGEQVWHQVELRNVTKVPWTTGAALILQEGRPLGQELLTYASRGASVRVPLTVAVDVAGDHDAEEVGRTPDALRHLGRAYAKVEMRARVSAVNRKAVPITLEATLRLAGRVDEAGGGAEVQTLPLQAQDWPNYAGHAEVNNSSVVRWRLDVEAGASVEHEVRFHYYLWQG